MLLHCTTVLFKICYFEILATPISGFISGIDVFKKFYRVPTKQRPILFLATENLLNFSYDIVLQ